METRCPVSLTICPVDATGTCITNGLSGVIRFNAEAFAGVDTQPSESRPSRLASRLCPIGTDLCPEVAVKVTSSSPTHPASNQTKQAAHVPRAAENPVASSAPSKTPMASVKRDLIGGQPFG
jgi:hypothetical protein